MHDWMHYMMGKPMDCIPRGRNTVQKEDHSSRHYYYTVGKKNTFASNNCSQL